MSFFPMRSQAHNTRERQTTVGAFPCAKREKKNSTKVTMIVPRRGTMKEGEKKKALFLLFLKSKILTKEKIRKREVVLCYAKRRIQKPRSAFLYAPFEGA